MRTATALSCMALLALSACGDSGQADGPGSRARQEVTAEGLPAPDSNAHGSVTGMPAPGSTEAVVSLGDDPTRPDGLPGTDLYGNEALAAGDPALSPLPDPPGATLPTSATGPPAAPAPGLDGPRHAREAMETIQRYYSAISAGDYDSAHRLWSGEGGASGQSREQFASGFADTADVRVHMMEPDRVEGAAGSRYIRVPVTITSTRRDGSTAQFTGSYILRQPSDGSGGWTIDSADLREVQR